MANLWKGCLGFARCLQSCMFRQASLLMFLLCSLSTARISLSDDPDGGSSGFQTTSGRRSGEKTEPPQGTGGEGGCVLGSLPPRAGEHRRDRGGGGEDSAGKLKEPAGRRGDSSIGEGV